MFRTCFVARVTGDQNQKAKPKSYICCRFDPCQWASPPPENLLSFCFPLGAENVRPREYMRPEEFSFTLTGGDGSRLHGFCRRTLPPRKAPAKSAAPSAGKMSMLRYPQVLCIVSPHPWFPLFYKVLELVEKMLRQEDTAEGSSQQWPSSSPAAMFLGELLQQIPVQPKLGQVVRVRLPQTEQPLDFSPPRRALLGSARSSQLHADLASVELEVPPDLGLGPENAGISAARLLFFLPPRVALTLVASLLMERRIILVASAEDKVSAAVHAAAALIYPFRWQHIYLPLLPISLKDYLAAPMPYLVGLNSDCLPMLHTMAMEEVLIVDLDLGECTPPPDNPHDDAFLLPYASKLLSALETCKDGTLSSTEFNSTPFIASIMQEYFLKLVGKYRLYIRPDLTSAASPRSSRGRNGSKDVDDVLRAHGYAFDQAAFVGQRKDAAVREFLQHFRNSQMFEVFITERLKMSSKGGSTQDSFEAKVSQLMSKQLVFGGKLPDAAAPGQPNGRFTAMLKKTANAMRQSSEGLVRGLKNLGPSQQEEYDSMPRRGTSNSTSFSGFSGLQRVSPVGGMHHANQGGGLKPHSRTPSFTQLAGRAPSFTHLNRPSTGYRPGAVSLDDVKPEVFFGDVDDDVGSEASEGGAYRSGSSSPGPLENGASRNRSFTSLFRMSGSQSAAPSPRHTQLQQSNSNGKSNSSPSLVSLDVKAGPGPPLLIDLGAASSAPQPGGGPPAGAAAAAAGRVLPAAAAVHPVSLGSSGGSGGFGSPALGSHVGAPVQKRMSSLHPSYAVRGMAAPAGQALSSAILGALSAAPTGSIPARHSTGSGSNEWTAFSSAGTGFTPLAARRTSSAEQQQLRAGMHRAIAGGVGPPVQPALASKLAVKHDAFGGLVNLAVTAVSEDLAVRRSTSSQDGAGTAAASSPAVPALPQEESWADFAGASATAVGDAGGQQQRMLEHTLSWGDWSSSGGDARLTAELAQKLSMQGDSIGSGGLPPSGLLQGVASFDNWTSLGG